MVLAGLWFGESKPNMLTFLKPFHKVLHKLENEGCMVDLPSGIQLTCRAILLLGTCDLPAKAMVCNTMQFNGAFGCTRCLQRGETVKTKTGGHVHAYPFDEANPSGPQRTHAEFMTDAKKAIDQGSKHVNGVKGPCWLSLLSHFDIVIGTVTDYMHCVLQGVVKLLLKLWFSSGERGKPHNVCAMVGEVDNRLLAIKPPNNITRTPRSIESRHKYWN